MVQTVQKILKKFKLEKKSVVRHETIWFVLLLLILIYPTVRQLIKPGYFYMQDDLQAFRMMQMDRCVQDLQIPCRWVPDAGYGYGYPQFIFYAPGVYYLGEVFHLLGLQFIDTVKLMFILGYLFSGLGMFLLVKTIAGKWSGLVAAVLYTYIPYKAVEVYVRGALSEFWTLVIFPYVFWAIYKLIKEEKRSYQLLLAGFIALLLLTHNLIPMLFLPMIIIWSVYWLFVEKKWRLSRQLIVGGLLGIGLSAFFTLPLLLEKKYVHAESLLGGYFDYRQHFVSLYKLFFDTSWGYGSSGFPDEKLNLSVGLVQWLFGVVSVGLALFNFKKNKRTANLILVLGTTTLVILFLVHMKSSFIWSQIPFLAWLQFPWRFLTLTTFLLAIITGLGLTLLKKSRGIVAVVLIILALVLNINYFKPRDWYFISDSDKFSGLSWQKQQTISIFDYLPIYATLPPITRAPDFPEVLKGEVNFLSYQKGSHWQKGEVDVKTPATVRLPLFDFPGMVVWVNNDKVEHVNNNCDGEEFCLGLITFNLTPGKHIIEARLINSSMRSLGCAVSALSLLIVLILIIKYRQNEKVHSQ